MPFGNHAEMGSQSELKVRPEHTDDKGALVHKKAKRLNMSVHHRFSTAYSVKDVMLGFRGDPDPQREQTGDVVIQNYARPETAKKGAYGPTPQHDGAI